jgi:hypothetical protein
LQLLFRGVFHHGGLGSHAAILAGRVLRGIRGGLDGALLVDGLLRVRWIGPPRA